MIKCRIIPSSSKKTTTRSKTLCGQVFALKKSESMSPTGFCRGLKDVTEKQLLAITVIIKSKAMYLNLGMGNGLSICQMGRCELTVGTGYQQTFLAAWNATRLLRGMILSLPMIKAQYYVQNDSLLYDINNPMGTNCVCLTQNCRVARQLGARSMRSLGLCSTNSVAGSMSSGMVSNLAFCDRDTAWV